MVFLRCIISFNVFKISKQPEPFLKHTEYNVWDEEDGSCDIELIPCEAEIFVHALDFRLPMFARSI
jgi:hypothetical protein